MARQRTPLDIAEATGAIEHNPKRFADRVNAPMPEGPIGDPPNHFEDHQRDIWFEIIALPAKGVLTSADRLLVETLVYLVWQQRTGEIKPVDRGHLRACLGSMGLTPADRSRVHGKNDAQSPADPLDILLGGNGAGKAN